jgi:hypothetical protein
MQKLKLNIQEHVKLYQSLWFEDFFLEDNNKFENIVYTPKQENILDSIQLMREQMFSENEFTAAVFIGGMNGIEDEFKMFREYHTDALLLPIASTGAATKIVYEKLLPDEFKNERLVKDYGYMSLFQKVLIDKI